MPRMLLDRPDGEAPAPESDVITKSPQSLLSVLRLTSQILFPRYPHALFPLLSALRLHSPRRSAEVVLEAVPRELFRALAREPLHGDAESCILVGHDLLDKLRVSGRPWVQLARPPHGTTTLVRAVPVQGLPQSIALATEDLGRNILRRLAMTATESPLAVDSISFSGLVATKVTLGLIQPTCNLENSAMDASLGTFFERPCYLCVGDIFPVSLNKYTTGYCGVDFLHFKVVELEGPNYTEMSNGDVNITVGYYVLKGHTAVAQTSNENDFLSPRTHIFVPGSEPVSGENYSSFLLAACPPGPDRACGELVSLLKPFLVRRRRGRSVLRVRPVFLLRGPCGAGKRTAVRAAARGLGLRLWEVDCLELHGSSPGQAEGKLKFVFTRVRQYSPCVLLLRNIHVLCHDKDGQEDVRVVACFNDELSKLYREDSGDFSQPGTKFVSVVATSNTRSDSTSGVPASVARLFLQMVDVGSPDAATRAAALDWLCRTCCAGVGGDLSLEHVAAQSPGFLLADLAALVARAIRLRALQTDGHEGSTGSVMLGSQDFQSALDSMHAAYSDAIGAPRIPTVKWEDVGGLAALKEEIMETITVPLRHPEIVASGLKRSGILLFGPPGTGKTLLAKAVATECSLNFLSVKGPELLNMYVGQSEQNVREVFERARTASPCVVFFDELDSLAPNRGRSGDSGGVMDRVVSQLLAEMDGLQRSSHVFVIATTNRPDLIDPALLRPGRFDKLLYVGASEDNASHLSILQALTRKFVLGCDVHLEELVKMLPRNVTGADMYSLCSSAWLNAVGSRITKLQSGLEDDTTSPVVVHGSDFALAASNLVPSVTEDDLVYFQQLRYQMAS